ncbi:MAG: family 10 glycosylhydrolase [bacterium]
MHRPLHRAPYAAVLAGLALLVTLTGCVRPPAPRPSPTPPSSPPPPLAAGTAARPVILVQASSSAPNAQERNYAASVTTRLAGWLKDVGIPTRIVDDEALSRGAAAEASVVILGYNPAPGSSELRALDRLIRRGGKVLVFYSAEPRLASLLGMKLGAYAAATEPGQWSAFRFNSAAPAGMPARVEQTSQNIRPVFPADPGAQVMAWWESASGKDQHIPAWARSDCGYWMSHVLLEGDGEAKKQLLVALLGSCDPALWRATAEQAVKTAGTLGRHADFAQALATLGASSERGGQGPRMNALLAQAEQLHDDLVRSFRRGDYIRTLATARLLDAALTEAYARTQAPRPGEFRGVWNHSGTGFSPGNWEETCRSLAQSGMTAVFPHMRRPWTAHYRTAMIPLSETAQRYGDQLQQCTEAARRHGLEVHAWVICWNLEGAPEALLASYRKQGRLQVSAAGASFPWLCPSHPANVAFEVDSIADMAARYRLDGVHLDYVRYKSPDYCYCSGCRARFEKETGLRVRRWPADVRSGSSPLIAAWRQWRRDQITRMVVQTRRRLQATSPRTRLSAAVYTGYPGCRDSIGQDWGEWARLGQVDFVCPMNYTEDNAKFMTWYRKQSALPGVRERLFPGIGVTATESHLTAAGALDQIAVLRGESAPGFMLFDGNRTLERDILPYLRMGATSSPAHPAPGGD